MMEHWDHRTCEGLAALGLGSAMLLSGTAIGVFLACGYGLGFF